MARWLVLAFGLLLAGCGFTPVHAPPAGNAEAVAVERAANQVRIQPIPERIGQMVHNNLQTHLNPKGQPRQPKYLLTVALEEIVRETGFRKDETATRANLELSANYQLVSAEDGEVVMRGRIRSINSANILEQPYATTVGERDARERGAEDVAARIAQDVASRLREM